MDALLTTSRSVFSQRSLGNWRQFVVPWFAQQKFRRQHFDEHIVANALTESVLDV
jgi:hypothetical protein